MPLIYRAVKGSKLTHAEADGNFAYLAKRVASAHFPGIAVVYTGKARWYPPVGCRIARMWASAGVAPTGDTIVTLYKNGTAVGTTTLSNGVFKANGSAIDFTMAVTDYLTASITQANGGEDISLFIEYEI